MNYLFRAGQVLLCIALTFSPLFAQKYSINEGWSFQMEDMPPQMVSLPHTWNAQDAQDDTPGFRRTTGTYTRQLHVPASYAGKTVYLHFEGANQITSVYLDEKQVGTHRGGYTRFTFDLSPYLRPGESQALRLEVDNRHHVDIPPLSADFTFFGGIYRDVYLDVREPLHISPMDFASTGTYLRTPVVNKENATLEVENLLNNRTSEDKNLRLEWTLLAPSGEKVTTVSQKLNIGAQALNQKVVAHFSVEKPILWTPDSPALYTVLTKVFEGDALRDESRHTTGFRWFKFDPKKGFFLNGNPLKLIGTSRHQDFKDKGYALEDTYHVRDVALLKSMGGNFLRVAHYPQDPLVLEMCDKLGILASVEIPIVNAITESEAFLRQSLLMTEEMVKQQFNHPSLVLWSYMNEVMLRPPYKNTESAYGPYCKEVNRHARAIQDRITALDPSRPTMIAFHGNLKAYEDADLLEVPQIIGWNLYQGWYSDKPEQFGAFLNRFHQKYPHKATLVSEYGADVDINIYSQQPERFDYSVEYGDYYHEVYLKTILSTPFISGAAVWNLNDFYSEVRKNTVPHVNTKGITGLNRTPKNTFYLYQAHLLKTPFLKIGSRDWNKRPVGNQDLKIYTNAKEIILFHNGKKLGKVKTEAGIARTQVPLHKGKNVFRAEIKGAEDLLEIEGQMPFENFQELNVALGSKRYFVERNTSTLWLPEQEYRPGSWGYIGGQALRPKTRYGELPTAEVLIKGTDVAPLYLTQRIDIEKFKADVPPGQYAVYLYWAELNGTEPAEAIAYNLGNDAVLEVAGKRNFDLLANGKLVLEGYEVDKEAGIQQAAIKKILVDVAEKGLTLEFKPKEGRTILNAVKIIKRD
jgi:beta-galactosidase